ncbi:MAG: DMT family transporter [Robiginitomaculum sp.]|nr:DMT family transporter [Robiginitomaculum sp.]
MQTDLKMGKTEWVLLLALSVIWGGSFFFSKIALVEIPPFTLVFSRVFLAAVTLFVVIWRSGVGVKLPLPLITVFFGMGLLNNLVPFSLIFYGQTQIASGLAAILNATTPIFTVLVAHFLTSDEHINPAKLAGIILGIIGIGIMLKNDLTNGFDLSAFAMLACLGAALSYAFASVYGRQLKAMKVAPLIGAWGQVTATTIMMLPIMLIVDRPWTLSTPSAPTIWAMLALGFISTALAYVIFFRILAKGGATNISLVALLIPMSAVLLGTTFLGEQLTWAHIYGMGLIGLGLVVLDGRAIQYLKNHKTTQRKGECRGLETHHCK